MSSGTVGFSGLAGRGFDLSAGVLDDFSVGVSQPGRARFRYNDVDKQLEISLDGAAFATIKTSDNELWTESSDPVGALIPRI